MSKKNKLPPEVISYWPEIFEDIEIKAVPIQYIRAVNVSLSDGTVLTIDLVEEKLTDLSDDEFEYLIEEILDDHEDEVESIDFSIDTERIKIDIKKRTDLFLKKRK